MIEAIKTNNFFVSACLALGSITVPTPGFVASPAPDFDNDFALGYIIIPAFGTIIGHIALRVMDSKTTFFYSKQVTAEDYTNSKLYIKETIQIR